MELSCPEWVRQITNHPEKGFLMPESCAHCHKPLDDEAAEFIVTEEPGVSGLLLGYHLECLATTLRAERAEEDWRRRRAESALAPTPEVRLVGG